MLEMGSYAVTPTFVMAIKRSLPCQHDRDNLDFVGDAMWHVEGWLLTL